MGRLAGGLTGAAFFVWIAGTRALDPGEIGWLMRYDWPVHFFGWHFFRADPWHWPPGLIDSYYAPIGTAIGFTDSIPLVAFALKPLSAWLPATFQYLGAWLLLCFVLQGAFAAWLLSRWTPRRSLQAAGAALFVLMPVLLVRIGHPALCAHWLLLWALVMATRDAPARYRMGEWGALGLISGLIHPYLAVMVLALLAGVAAAPADRGLLIRARPFGVALAATLVGWWACGLFSVAGTGAMATEGLGHYSMNLLAPISATGWSLFLPDLPRATTGQDFEGFQYVGLGVLILVAVSAALSADAARFRSSASAVPSRAVPVAVLAVAVLMAIYALSPRITVGSLVVLDLTGPLTERLAVFRATGRFFWPLAYITLAWALATVIRRWPSRLALTFVIVILTVQAIDLHGAHEQRRQSARDPAFHAWAQPMTSPAWARVLPHYDHLVLYPPPQCGPAPIPYEPAAYMAGLYRLTINTGGVARPDDAVRLRYCHDLGEQFKAGTIDDRSIYIVLPSEVEALRRDSSGGAVCGVIDTLSVCVTARSYSAWQALAGFR